MAPDESRIQVYRVQSWNQVTMHPHGVGHVSANDGLIHT